MHIAKDTMSLKEILSTCHKLGIRLSIKDEQIKISDPQSNITPALIDIIKHNKSDLLKILPKTHEPGNAKKIVSPADFPYSNIDKSTLKKLLQSYPQINHLYIATPMQHGMLYHGMVDESGASYTTQTLFEINGSLTIPCFIKSWEILIKRHDIFRTCFVGFETESVHQLVLGHAKLPIIELDWSHYTDLQQNEMFDDLLLADKKRGFDFSSPPLMRISIIKFAEKYYKLIWSHHHVLLDGWCSSTVFGEFLHCYNCFSNNHNPKLQKIVPYQNYIAWLFNKDKKPALAYWNRYLSGIALPTDMGIKYVEKSNSNSDTNEQGIKLSVDITKKLDALAKVNQCTMNVLLQAAWSCLLYRYSGNKDVIFGTTVSGRPANLPGIESIMGLFINTIPIRFKFKTGISLKEMLEQLHKDNFQHNDFNYLSLADIQLHSEILIGTALFNTLIVFENFLTDRSLIDSNQVLTGSDHSISVTGLGSKEETNYALTILVEQQESLLLRIKYDASLICTTWVNQVLTHLNNVLSTFATHSHNLNIDRIDLLTKEEKHKLLIDWNNSAIDYARNTSLADLFESIAENFPEKTALINQQNKWSYKILNESANRLANYILQYSDLYLAADKQAFIGLCLNRSDKMLIALLAILKTGAAYVPLDPQYPQARLNYMIEDSGLKLIISEKALANELQDNETKILFIDDLPSSSKQENNLSNNPCISIDPDNPCHIIYTSGSTGKPKGVMICHKSVMVLIAWLCKEFTAEECSNVLFSTSICFDLSIFEIWSAWSNSGCIHLVKNALSLVEEPENGHSTVKPTLINTVPSAMMALLDSEYEFDNIKVINLAGEQLKRSLVDKIFNTTSVNKVYNLYGPSEDTTYSTYSEISKSAWLRWPEHIEPNIGRGIGNTYLYVLNDNGIVHPGGVGELHIAGDGLALGYLNQVDLTTEKFISGYPGLDHIRRLYKTGDMVRWTPDGQLEFIGRMDQQLKVRGFRIEIGEIENCLKQQSELMDYVVVAESENDKQESQHQQYLVAYLVLAQTCSASVKDKHLQKIRDDLLLNLPDFMVPSHFVWLDSLPLTPNGKLDRKALPKPVIPDSGKQRLKPATLLESQLYKIWSDVLAINNISTQDNFFFLGGHSLSAMRLVSLIRQQLQLELPLRVLFENPSISLLAQALEDYNPDMAMPKLTHSEHTDNIPLSFSQQRLWFIDQLEGGSSQYNMPGIFSFNGKLDYRAFEQTIYEILHRHQILRTRYVEADGSVRQQLIQMSELPSLFSMAYIDLSACGTEEQKTKAQHHIRNSCGQYFDLCKDIMLRVQLIILSSSEHIICFTLHHIAADAWSINILLHEFTKLYKAFSNDEVNASLERLTVQYADYACWQRQCLQGDLLQKHIQYWTELLNNAPEIHHIPLDYPRPVVQTFAGGKIDLSLGGQQLEAIRQFCRHENITLFMLLHTVYALLLARYSGENDIVLGVPVSGRDIFQLQSLIGFFVNTLAFRTKFDDSTTVESLLVKNREQALNNFSHQQLPFELLVESINPSRNLRYSPVFQILFNFLNQEELQLETPDLKFSGYKTDYRTVRYELELEVIAQQDEILFNWLFNKDLFDKNTIKRMADNFTVLLKEVVSKPKAGVCDLNYISNQEIKSLIEGFRAPAISTTDTDTDRQHSGLPDIFTQQVQQTPKSTAVTTDTGLFTYEEINNKANQLAHYLIQQGITSDHVVGLCMTRSVDLLVGLLAILKTGASYVPIDPEYPEKRIAYLLDAARITFLLTQQSIAGSLLTREDLYLYCYDDEKLLKTIYSMETSDPSVLFKPESLAHIIFTSGSTGKPKGVMITQQNVLALLNWINEEFTSEQRANVLFSTSVCFDLSIFEIWSAWSCGGCVQLVKNPMELISNSSLKPSLINTVPSAIHALLDYGYTFSEGTVINLAGEPLKRQLVDKIFAQKTVDLIYNLYGPSEDTTYTTFSRIDRSGWSQWADSKEPDIGFAVSGTQLYIMREQSFVQQGGVGELYISGEGLSSGYYRQAEMTDERFIMCALGKIKPMRLYKTGDMVRYQVDGSLAFLGRVDDQVKIRGFRIEPGEIEQQLLLCDNVSSSVVLCRKSNRDNNTSEQEEKHLVAYILPDKNVDTKNLPVILKQQLEVLLPRFMLPTVFIIMDSWPLTPNGKIDKKALPDPSGVSSDKEYFSAETQLEHTIVNIWSRLLNLPAGNISVTDNFFDLGGHSLLAVRLAAEIRNKLCRELSLRDIFDTPNIRKLAGLISSSTRKPVTHPLLSVSRDNQPLTLSFSQQRLWFIDKMENGSSQYNIQILLGVKGNFDINIAEQAFIQIIQRHEILRTVIVEQSHEPYQKINEQFNFKIQRFDLSTKDKEQQQSIIKQIVREDNQKPFDLGSDVMIRACYFCTGNDTEQEGRLLFNVHHIAADGWSIGIMINEFISHYRSIRESFPNTLPPLPVQYADYAHWQRILIKEQLSKQLAYWTDHLLDAPTVHELPLDYERPEMKTYQGASISGFLSEELSQKLQELARQHNITLFMLLHGVIALLFSRHSNNADILIGTPVANRMQEQLEPLIGFFVNTLVLRTSTDYEHLADYLSHVQQVNLDAQSNQDVPFDYLVDHCQVLRNTQHSPLFQILFSMNTTDRGELKLPGINFTTIETEQSVVKFDLDINAELTGNGIFLTWVYDVSLFREKHIQCLDDDLKRLLVALTDSPNIPIHHLPMMADDEVRNLIYELNNSGSSYPDRQLINELFEARATQNPDNIALVFGHSKLSYQELNNKANRIAHRLREEGVEAETLVGICLERSMDMIITILAILKSGATYVPLDPDYPQERLQYMLADSGISILISQSSISKNLSLPPEINIHELDTPSYQQQLTHYSAANPERQRGQNSESTAYIIYTSGSTGLPKGVMISHRSAVNLAFYQSGTFDIGTGSRMLHFSSLSFDASVWEMMSLLHGAELYICSETERKSPDDLQQFLISKEITHATIPPALLHNLAKRNDYSLQCLIVAGESFDSQLTEFWASNYQMINAYGPTESAVCATMAPLQAGETITIGRRIYNFQLYILDSWGALAPSGTIGELHIGGDGVAIGYLNRPELTAERFINNIFINKPDDRLYKTGDLVRYRPDFNLEFIGRIDDQMKIRGHRIEIGEIEHQLQLCDNVKSSLLLFHNNLQNNKQLVAYIILTNHKELSEYEYTSLLRQKLQQVLPEYMIPSVFIIIKEWPLTTNGKIDTKALPHPNTAMQQQEYIAPETEVHTALTEIWASVLNLAAEKISISANFFELGGDSILSIQLVSRAAKQGLFFSVKDLFAAQTIRQLALLVSTESNIIATQNPVEGRIILLPIQREFFRDETDLHHFNQAVLLSTPASFNRKALSAIISKIYESHDVLRLKFFKVNNSWNAEHIPFSQTMLEKTLVIEEWAHSSFNNITAYADEVQKSLDPEQGLLFKAVYIHSNDPEKTTGRLLLVIHHLVIDGVSWRILLQDMETLYGQWLSETTMETPAKTTSYQQWGKFLLNYANNSKELLKERDYWLKVFEKESINLQSYSAQKVIKNTATDQGLLIKSAVLNEEITGLLLTQANKTYHTNINELLLAGLILGINQWCGGKNLRIDMEGHGREILNNEMDLGRTLGWFTSLFPVTLSISEADSIQNIICTIKEQYRSIPNNGIGFGLLKYLREDEEFDQLLPAELVYNYLGQFNQLTNPETHFGIAPESTGKAFSTNRKNLYPLMLNSMVTESGLSYALAFDSCLYCEHDMDNMLNAIIQAMEEITQHCTNERQGCYTPSDFPLARLSYDELLEWQHNNPHIEDLYPATGMQQGLLFHSMLETGSYVTQTAIEFKDLDRLCFYHAWLHTIKQHAVFRTAFMGLESENPHQLVNTKINLPWHVKDLSQLSEADKNAEIHTIMRIDREKEFNPAVAPLMRITVIESTDNRQLVLWSHHHALMDGWSLPIVFDDLSKSYYALQANESLNTDYISTYREYMLWLSKQDYSEAKRFWSEQVADIESPTIMAISRDRSVQDETANGLIQHNILFSEHETTNLSQTAQHTRTTINILLQAAWSLLLSRYSGDAQVIFGATTSGRPAELKNVEKIVGLFINSLPIITQIETDCSLYHWFQLLHKQQIERESFNYLPLYEIQQLAPQTRELFNHLLVFENYPIEQTIEQQNAESDLQLQKIQVHEGTNYDLTLIAHPGPQLSLKFEVKNALMEKKALIQMAEHLKHIMLQFCHSTDILITEIDILTQQEKLDLLHNFNAPLSNKYSGSFVHKAIEKQLAITAGNKAVCCNGRYIDYTELNQQSDMLARCLQMNNIGDNEFVGLCMDRSVEIIIAMLGVLKAGSAYVFLDPEYPKSRLDYLIDDAAISVVLSLSHLPQIESDRYQVIYIDQIESESSTNKNTTSEKSLCQITSATDLNAYMIYTSGSTGTPKGVTITHSKIMNLLNWYIHEYRLDEDDNVLIISASGFDLTQKNFLAPLLVGASIHFATAADYDVEAILTIIREQNISFLNCAPSAFYPLVESVADYQELKNLRYVLLGGEAIDYGRIQSWYTAPTINTKLVNMYGPTEATDITCVYNIPEHHATNFSIPIGKPIPGVEVYILNKQMQLLPETVSGELHIGGISLSSGYHNNPQLTVEKFVQSPFTDNPQSLLYKTGDLVRRLQDGNMEFIGRVDHQVKIRGYRVEIGEIENQLNKLEAVREAAVIAWNKSLYDNYLTAYLVAIESPLDLLTIKRLLSEQLPAYMIPSHFVELNALPLTANGKINRRAFIEPDLLNRQQSVVEPRNHTELKLCEIWQLILKIEKIGIKDDFFSLGGHSLSAARIISLIRRDFDIELPLRQMFMYPTIEELAECIHELSGEGEHAALSDIVKAPARTNIPLSFAQQRLWFIDQLEEGSNQYNMPGAFSLNGEFNRRAFCQSVQSLFQRHHILRTKFIELNDDVYQNVVEVNELPLINIDLSDYEHMDQHVLLDKISILDNSECFNLKEDLMLRIKLITLSPHSHIILFNMHHIASDGWSINILVKEFAILYKAFSENIPDPLVPLTIQYADYAYWQREWVQGELLDNELVYWQFLLQDIPEVHNLPLDKPRPNQQTFVGNHHRVTLDSELSHRLYKFCQQENITLFMLLQTVFAVLVARYSGEDDVVIGTPVAGRNHHQIEPLIGLFVNTLIMRTNIIDNPEADSLLARSKAQILDSFEHQNLPFEMLVDLLNPTRNLRYSPIFQIMFSLQNNENFELEFSDVTLEAQTYDNTIIKFDLELEATEFNNEISLCWSFNTDLFERQTIERMAANFFVLIDSFINSPEQTVYSLPLLSIEEQRLLLVDWNDTEANYSSDLCMHELFEKQVELTPHNPAVSFGEETLSYRQLNNRSNQLANFLISKGVTSEKIIAVLDDRSIDFLVIILAILKSGGCYLPLDPKSPVQRYEKFLKQGHIFLLLVGNQYLESLAELDNIELLRDKTIQPIDDIDISNFATDNLLTHQKPEQLAYIIFTSGTTGNPKGAMIEYAGMQNHLDVMIDVLNLTENDVVVQSASQCFDISVWQFLTVLLVGGKVAIFSDDEIRDPYLFLAGIRKQSVTVLQLVPSLLQAILNEIASQRHLYEYLKDITCIIPTGEALKWELCRDWFQFYPDIPMLNAYGPAECADDVSLYLLKGINSHHDSHPIPIGQPVANMQLYVMNNELQIQPIGVVGELFIGGVGVGRGYLGDEEQTNQAFMSISLDENKTTRLYRSGDIVRRLPDSNLEFMGRFDHQVKIRGFRIELGEIETQLLKQPSIQEVVVIGREFNGDNNCLVAYLVFEDALSNNRDLQTVSKQAWISEVNDELKQHLPDYMVPNMFVVLDQLPLTPNGKIDRKALPEPQLSDQIDQQYAAPRNDIEERLCHVIAKVLRLEKIGIYDNFFSLGADSIISIQMVSRAKNQGLIINVRQIFEHQTIATLAPFVTFDMHNQDNSNIQSYQKAIDGELKLLPIQSDFFKQQIPDRHHYNLSALLETPSDLHMEQLSRIVMALVQRHDALRLNFYHTKNSKGEESWQAVHQQFNEQKLQNSLYHFDLSKLTANDQKACLSKACNTLQAGFTLSDGLLVKVAYFNYGNQNGRLLFVIHHLIMDGVSWRILMADFDLAYQQLLQGQDIELLAKTASYQLWSETLYRYAYSNELKSERFYWFERLNKSIEILPGVNQSLIQLNPAEETNISIVLDNADTQYLTGDANLVYQTQINELLLTALYQAFRNWSRQKIIRINMEGHGRYELFEHLDINETIGWFTNYYPLILDLSHNDILDSITELGIIIKSIKEQYRSLPKNGMGYGLLKEILEDVEICTLDNNTSACDIEFNYLGQFDSAITEGGDFKLAPESAGREQSGEQVSTHLISINGIVIEGELTFTFYFNKEKIEQSSIEVLSEEFHKALCDVVQYCQNIDTDNELLGFSDIENDGAITYEI